MDDLDLIVRAQDKEFWDKVTEELKTTIKRALEETFEPTKCENEFVKEKRNDILQKRLEDYPWKKEQKCECYTCIYAPNKECGWYAACNNCIDGSNYWKKEEKQ